VSLRWLLLGLVLLAGCDGCDSRRTNATRHLATREAKLAALRESLGEARDVLPLKGNEHEVGCGDELHADLVGITEDHLRALARKDGVTDSSQRALSGEPLRSLMTVSEMTEFNDDVDADKVEGMVEGIDTAAELTHILVIRTDSLDDGAVEGREIKVPGSWHGWAFVIELATPRLVASLPGSYTTGSFAMGERGSMTKWIRRGIYTHLNELTKRSCSAALLPLPL
jgi:hypothetical protein